MGDVVGLAGGDVADGDVGLADGDVADGDVGLAGGDVADGDVGLADGDVVGLADGLVVTVGVGVGVGVPVGDTGAASPGTLPPGAGSRLGIGAAPAPGFVPGLSAGSLVAAGDGELRNGFSCFWYAGTPLSPGLEEPSRAVTAIAAATAVTAAAPRTRRART